MDIQKQIQDRMYSLLSEGVHFFPRFETDPVFSEQKTQEEKAIHVHPQGDLTSCKRCPLATSRKRVVVSNHIQPKRFFVLSDFPRKADEESQVVFAAGSVSSILENLVQKMGIFQNAHLSFALKCVPDKGIPRGGLASCSAYNLAFELETVAPEVLFCFGYRAFAALCYLDEQLKGHDFLENQDPLDFRFKKRQIQLFCLPSAQDLQNFPSWRTQVWKQLERFSAQKR